jgi:low temperature requirement protein LtrA
VPLSFDRLRGRAVVRDVDESDRAASPLELFFDLTFVVAVSRASASLHHELAAGHVADGILGFLAAFFAVWWAWMNFTWFASAHDSDDVPFRLLTLVQMAGVLVLAAGIPRAAEHGQFSVAVLGYVVMRVGLVGSWLRVARDEPSARARALRYAGGITVLQVCWIVRLALPGSIGVASFVVLALAELLLPVWAERAASRPLYNADHIFERYGLFTMILLGESILSATVGFQTAVDEAGFTAALMAVGISGLVLAFAAWWLYFDHPGHLAPTPPQSFRWGYGHVLIFVSLAALGAGINLAAEAAVGHGDERVAALAVAIPTAGYLAGIALVLLLTGTPAFDIRVYPKLAGAAVVLLIGSVASVSGSVVGCAAVMTVLVTWMVLAGALHDLPGAAQNELVAEA